MYCLFKKMKRKYPNKKLVFILDNLAAHKSSLIMKLMSRRLKLLFTPASSPQFSPIENLFGLTKQRMMDFEITTKEKLA